MPESQHDVEAQLRRWRWRWRRGSSFFRYRDAAFIDADIEAYLALREPDGAGSTGEALERDLFPL